MSGTNDFKQWNPNKNNQLSTSEYEGDTMREEGAQAGEYPSNIHNKFAYQVSTMVAAIAQVVANKGFDVSDVDISSLIPVLAQSLGNMNYSWLDASGPMISGHLNGIINLKTTNNNISYTLLDPTTLLPGSWAILHNSGGYVVSILSTLYASDIDSYHLYQYDTLLIYTDGVRWYSRKWSNAASVRLNGNSSHFIRGDGSIGLVPNSSVSMSDNTTGNSTTSAHGFIKKLSGLAYQFMNGEGNWTSSHQYTAITPTVLLNGVTPDPRWTLLTISTSIIPSTAKMIWGFAETLGATLMLAPSVDGRGAIYIGAQTGQIWHPFTLPVISSNSIWYRAFNDNPTTATLYVSGYAQ